eukprot:783465-Prymnesium_polylepis.1
MGLCDETDCVNFKQKLSGPYTIPRAQPERGGYIGETRRPNKRHDSGETRRADDSVRQEEKATAVRIARRSKKPRDSTAAPTTLRLHVVIGMLANGQGHNPFTS